MKRIVLLAVPLVAIDQLIKAFIRRIPVGSVCFELPGLVEFTHVTNMGAAFSLFSGNPTLLLMISALLLILLCVVLYRTFHLTKAAQITSVFLLAGGVGNMIDRALFGGVTDYIRLIPVNFPVFNFADILTTCSCAALLLLLARGKLEIRGDGEK